MTELKPCPFCGGKSVKIVYWDEEITELKDELNGWQEDPFAIIADICETNKDCKSCLWFEKCPFKDYGEYPNDWRKG